MRVILITTLVAIGLVACASKAPSFSNPHIDDPDKSFFDYVAMRWFSDVEFADHSAQKERIEVIKERVPLHAEADERRATWLGHSSFLLQHQGVRVLTDPILSDRASPLSFVGPKRLAPVPYGVNDLPPIDVVVISHNHYDHLDAKTIRALGNRPHYYVPKGVKAWFIDLGIDPNSVTELDWWQSDQHSGVEVTATPAQHWSGRGLFDRLETHWVSFHLNIEGWQVWFGGDTGYNAVQFQQVGERFPNIDLGLIPIGSYAPRFFMKPYHVNPEEALDIHTEIGASISVGMHWSTFQLSAEPLDEPKRRLQALMAEQPKGSAPFITLPIGGHLRR